LDTAVGAFGARQSLSQIDDAALAKGADRLAAFRVDRLHVAVDGEDQPSILAVRASPVVDAAARDAVQTLVDPDLLARRRVERDERIVPAQHVHRPVGDDRVEASLAVRIEPGDFEPANVRPGDLIEIDEVRIGGVAAEVGPPLVIRCRRECDVEKSGSRHESDQLLHAVSFLRDLFA
jgi:hypothetical protein